MFQQFYEPHPALKGFVNNIMIHQCYPMKKRKHLMNHARLKPGKNRNNNEG